MKSKKRIPNDEVAKRTITSVFIIRYSVFDIIFTLFGNALLSKDVQVRISPLLI